MDISYNKVDQTALPISQNRVSASEYNQIAASLMHIITASGLTPDSADNAQLLAALGPRIVETYSNGTSWYRVYSDGWCEQGGYIASTSTDSNIVTVNLLKQFTNTNYNVAIANSASSSVSDSTNVNRYGVIKSYTSSTINIMIRSTTYQTGCFWQASGYIS